jgi:hypothetical protein
VSEAGEDNRTLVSSLGLNVFQHYQLHSCKTLLFRIYIDQLVALRLQNF